MNIPYCGEHTTDVNILYSLLAPKIIIYYCHFNILL